MPKGLFYFVLGLFALMSAVPASAQPASDDVCSRYASEAVSRYNRARAAHCDLGGSRLTGDYNRLFNACKGWQFPRVSSESLTMATEERLACERKVTPGRAAPQNVNRPVANRPAGGSDPSRHPVCSSFGNAAANWEQRAMAQGCRLPLRGMTNFNGNSGSAYNWCMRTSDRDFRGRSPQALGHKSLLERGCSAQLRRPVGL